MMNKSNQESKDLDKLSKKSLPFYLKPLNLFLATVISIFISETLIMFVLVFFSPLPLYQASLLDSFLLTVIIFPILFFIFFKRLDLHIKEQIKAQNEKEVVIDKLKIALSEIKTLQGILPICSSCKKIRDEDGHWHQIEDYIRDHSEAGFTHGLCPVCSQNIQDEWKKK